MQHRCLKCAAPITLPDAQRFNVCPECGAVQAKVSVELQALDEQLSQPSSAPKPLALAMHTALPTAHSSPASGLAMAAWAMSLLCALAAALYAVVALAAATSAPQQAAAAATACAAAIIPYVCSRAIDRLTQR